MKKLVLSLLLLFAVGGCSPANQTEANGWTDVPGTNLVQVKANDSVTCFAVKGYSGSISCVSR